MKDKTCVFIAGTNCAGKTTLAKELISRFGGICSIEGDITFCGNHTVAFVGHYSDASNYGGVDRLGETRSLARIVETALQTADVCICEGSYLDTFGLNLTNAMFKAKRYLYVFLYAPLSVINERLATRSGNLINERIISKQRRILNASKKWQQIGIPVICIDTSKNKPREIADEVLKLIL